MAQRSRLLDMMQGQGAPPGASPEPIGTDAIPTPQLAAGPPEMGAAEGGAAPPEGETESQNAIMQAMAAQPGQQMTPEEEEMIKAQLNMAARQKLLGGAM